MTSNGWIKLYRCLLTDSKVCRLSASRKWCFVAYLLIAQHEGRWRGYLTNDSGVPLTGTEKAALVGCADRSGILRMERDMIEAGLLVVTDGGRLKIRNYEKYQVASGNPVAEPVAKTQHQGCLDLSVVAEPVAKPVAVSVAKTQQTRTKSTAHKKIRSKEENISHSREFEIFYQAYPRATRRTEAERAWNARLKEGLLPESLIEAAKRYAEYCREARTEERYIMYPSSFLGPERRGYEEWLTPKLRNTRAPKSQPHKSNLTRVKELFDGEESGGEVVDADYRELPECQADG